MLMVMKSIAEAMSPASISPQIILVVFQIPVAGSSADSSPDLYEQRHEKPAAILESFAEPDHLRGDVAQVEEPEQICERHTALLFTLILGRIGKENIKDDGPWAHTSGAHEDRAMHVDDAVRRASLESGLPTSPLASPTAPVSRSLSGPVHDAAASGAPWQHAVQQGHDWQEEY